MDEYSGCKNEWGSSGCDEWGGRAAMDEVYKSWQWMGGRNQRRVMGEKAAEVKGQARGNE